MKIKTFLRITSGMSMLMFAVGATGASAESLAAAASQGTAAQDKKADDTVELTLDAEETPKDVLVIGIRKSTAESTEKKRNSKQIVDSVTAEDAGKLPDNNVPEALARVPGVQIDRAHGEGQNVTIRGLSDVQTTINGYEAAGAGSRSLNLADIPAELLKSVEVYKTRSADQVEGGIAGTVNVELRRPLDLKKGLTVAGSFRETFSDLGDTKSPYASLLLAERFDTPIGEMGFLLNGSYTQNNYFENYVVSESPMPILNGTAKDSVATALQGTVIPYAVNYGVESGKIKRPSLNASWQWRANEHLDFVLEGSYLGVRSTDSRDNLRVVTNDGSGTYTNLVANSDGTVRSVTLNNANGVNAGPISIFSKTKSDTYTTNFETHWRSDKVQINFGAQYNWSKSKTYYVQEQFRYTGGTAVSVDFDSPNVPGGGPYVTFPGVDISDPANYKLYQIHDQRSTNDDTFFASNLDFTVEGSPTGLVRSVQFGTRFSKHTMGSDYGYRDAFFFNTASAPSLETVAEATGVGLATTTPDISGASQVPTWYHFDGQSLYDNFAAVRSYLIGNGANLQGRDWTLSEPATTDPGESFQEQERTFAAYGQVNYGFKAHFPIEGTIGLRFVNTWGKATSSKYTWTRFLPDGKPDYSSPVIYTPTSSQQNYIDLLPSATAIVHFSPKMQLRLSYTHNVQRPSFYDMRSSLNFLDASTSGYVYKGNPDLKATQENSYDASLEYYWGRGGIISLGTFLKNQTGFMYYTVSDELVPELGANPAQADGKYHVGMVRNAGPGKIFGLEGQVNTFFDFLPGFAKNFGVNMNFTYIPVASLHLGYATADLDTKGLFDAPYTSKYSGNIALLYDTPVFGARVAYNFRSHYKTNINYDNPGYSIYTKATSRLDASINYTPLKFITLSLEATNLLHDNANSYFGAYDALPVGVRVQARTIQAGARFRF